MNRKDIAESIHKKVGIKRFEAYGFVDLLIESISECLHTGEKVVLSNFGTFKVVQRQRKRVINPNDKQAMFIPERKIVKFIPSRELRALVGSRKK